MKYFLLLLTFGLYTGLTAQNWHPGNWQAGLGGNVHWENMGITEDKHSDSESDDTFLGTSANAQCGYFFQEDLALGLEYFNHTSFNTKEPKNNPEDLKMTTVESRNFVGPYLRYYYRFGQSRWFVYPQLSVGLSIYNYRYQEDSNGNLNPKSTITATGLGYNLGSGLGYLLTDNLSLDVQARYSGGVVSGDVTREKIDTTTQSLLHDSGDYEADINGLDVIFNLQYTFGR